MQHVAILRKAKITKRDNLLQDIIDGAKTIESRWYVNKIAPWDQIKEDDVVYLKESGGKVQAKAVVERVIQYENMNSNTVSEIINKFGKQIAPHSTMESWDNWEQNITNKRYCILIFLKNVEKLTPFDIDKTGFGNACAWLVIDNIDKIRL